MEAENLRFAWPYGGSGYLLSRRLLESISAEQWLTCQREILSHGGDQRVAACVYSWAGIALTHLPGLGSRLSQHRSTASACVT